MDIRYTEELKDYMQKKQKRIIIVEVVTSNASDFEITEFSVHFVTEKQAEYFVKKKKFRRVKTELGEVLLPNYHLEYDDAITFGMKSFWFINWLTQTGIRL